MDHLAGGLTLHHHLGGAAVSPQEAQPETLAGKAGSAASGDG